MEWNEIVVPGGVKKNAAVEIVMADISVGLV